MSAKTPDAKTKTRNQIMLKYSRRDWLAVTAFAGAGLMKLRLHAAATTEASDLILIPGGAFLMGTTPEQAAELARQFGHHPSWLAGEIPQRRVELPAFLIDKYPVTNLRYAAFVKATGARAPFDWINGQPAPAQLNLPVRFVNRNDARAFARWAGQRLPTSAEWEKAARGTDGRLYPWGNEFIPAACQHDRGGAIPPAGHVAVTDHPLGASPYGVMDMAGNIAEYCGDQPGQGSAYIRGGCWLTASPLNLRCAAIGISGAEINALDHLGFRCAKDT